MVVIVTRPASAGQRLFDRVIGRGHTAVRWPAFDIGVAPDAAAAREVMARLADYQLAIFVSPTAVSATRALFEGPWPVQTIIGAVGAATREAIKAELCPGRSSTLVAPLDANDSGSEAFWQAWQASGRSVRNVLLLRAEQGRDWLAQRFLESGSMVDTVAVYERRPHDLTLLELAQLQQWISDGTPALTIFSSTEAVQALDAQVSVAGREWLRAGIAIACHPRISRRLTFDGYTRVMHATFDDDSIIATLESIRKS